VARAEEGMALPGERATMSLSIAGPSTMADARSLVRRSLPPRLAWRASARDGLVLRFQASPAARVDVAVHFRTWAGRTTVSGASIVGRLVVSVGS
jgi:hypothetical protein